MQTHYGKVPAENKREREKIGKRKRNRKEGRDSDGWLGNWLRWRPRPREKKTSDVSECGVWYRAG